MSQIRNRLTSRVNAARVKLELRRSMAPLAFLIVSGVVGLLAWVWLLGHVGKPDAGSSMLSGGTYKVKFEVDDARAARGGRSYVRFKGIPAGKIVDDELVDGRPVLTAQIYKSFGPVYRSARAVLRPTSALENMYLDIVDRGTPASGPATQGGPLPASQTDTGTHVARALQIFEPDVRAYLGTLMTQMGQGLDDRGDELRTTFAKAIPFIQVAAKISDQFAQRRQQTRRLVTDLSTLSNELADRDQDLRRLSADGGRAMSALSVSSRDLAATLAELPPTLQRLGSSFAATSAVLPKVDRAVGALVPVADALSPGLTDLERLSDTARPAVKALRSPVRQLVPLAKALSPTAKSLARATTAALPQIGALDHVTKSFAGCPLVPYGFFQWTPSVFSIQDSRGVTVRGDLTLGLDSVSGVKDPNVTTLPSCAPNLPYPVRANGK
jgi:ABC-type transporter Mla subunit MlaD